MTYTRRAALATAGLVLTSFLGNTVAGQPAAIKGRVRVAGADEPLAQATIVIVGTTLRALSDSGGRYFIGGAPVGRIEIEARRPGAAFLRLSETVGAGDTVTVDFALAPIATELVGIEVIGAPADALSRLPGSASVIGSRELTTMQPISANDVLRTVTGVHVQEEEGAGLRANIGIRGLDPDRSRTVLVLEDGVPIALAPYGEPELYYSPPIDRMDRVEIIKGSGSILFGPQTIGGVVNYVTANAPARPEGLLTVKAGGGGYRNTRLRYGGTWDDVGASVSAFRKQADDWNGLRYRVGDVTAKIGAHTGLGAVALKLSAYDESSNATYVGLTDSLFRADPHVHPRPDDELNIRRYAMTATHELSLGTATTLRTNAYAYQTSRNWTRRDYTYTANRARHVFQRTTGSRDRAFEVLGIEPRLRTVWAAGSVTSELEGGVRAHFEWARDRHVNGSIDGSTADVVRDDERRIGRAGAAFLQNRFRLGHSVSVTPGVRAEYFEFERAVLRMRSADVDVPAERDRIGEVIPGIGAAWSPNALATVFAGAHRGFAPPRTKDAFVYRESAVSGETIAEVVPLRLDAERSWNYEVGTRLTPRPGLTLEATLFLLEFSNQIIEPSLSSGAVSQARLANQGATRHRGIEGGASLDVAKWLAQPYSLTFAVTHTYSDAAFSRDRSMARGADTINVRGNRLPYSPRHKTGASASFDHPSGIAVRLDGTFISSQYADNFETETGSADGRTGRIPSYRVLDLSARYRLPSDLPLARTLTLTAAVRNLTDEVYIASRRPEGIKPGLPRLITFGADIAF